MVFIEIENKLDNNIIVHIDEDALFTKGSNGSIYKEILPEDTITIILKEYKKNDDIKTDIQIENLHITSRKGLPVFIEGNVTTIGDVIITKRG